MHLLYNFYASLAQSVERLTRNEKVSGSNPLGSFFSVSSTSLLVLSHRFFILRPFFLYRLIIYIKSLPLYIKAQ